MKIVAYHADSHYADKRDIKGLYERLWQGFQKNCNGHGWKTVHVTLEGFPCWGDEAFFVSGLDPKNVMLNREIAFCEFLKQAPDDVYLFNEPDYRFFRGDIPELTTDAALLYREGDGVPINPSWRMARPSALPVFEFLRDQTIAAIEQDGKKPDWHCDSAGFARAYKKWGEPIYGVSKICGVQVEFRKFSEYVKPNPIWGMNYAYDKKKWLLAKEDPRGVAT